MTSIPSLTLNNGVKIPQLGLGTYLTNDGNEVIDSIHAAIQNGYRMIDTAAMYGNEQGVGEAIRTSGVPREEIFVQTKVWNSDQGHDETLRAFDKSLERLGFDYIDMYLIHWPMPGVDKYVETWKAMEEIYESGRAKAIGVCNFNVEHFEKLLATANVVPTVNQIEFHPHLNQRELHDYCSQKDIKIEAWRPLGGSKGDLMSNETIVNIADKHSRTPAQVLLRWSIQQGNIIIPKSVHADRIKQNAEVFDFELDNDDVTKISALNTGERDDGPDPATMNSR